MAQKSKPISRATMAAQGFLSLITLLAAFIGGDSLRCWFDSLAVLPTTALPPSASPETEMLQYMGNSYVPSWWQDACQSSSAMMYSLQVRLPVGKPAPDFKLQSLDGNHMIQLSDYRKARPVVLVFGSFTCGALQSAVPTLNQLSAEFKDRANFLFIAAPEAGHPMPGYEFLLQDGARLLKPDVPHEGRRERLNQARKKAGLTWPGLFDPPDYETCCVYRAWPGRLVVVDAEGILAEDFGAIVLKVWKLEDVRARLEVICQQAEGVPAVSVGSPSVVPLP
jgi:thiol-disulfide isomerase/thioredoxin